MIERWLTLNLDAPLVLNLNYQKDLTMLQQWNRIPFLDLVLYCLEQMAQNNAIGFWHRKSCNFVTCYTLINVMK